MKNKIKKGMSLLLLSIFALSPVVSNAQIGAGLTGNTTGNIDSDLNNIIDTDISTDASMDGSVSSGNTVDVSAEGNLNSEVRTNTDDDMKSESSEYKFKLNDSGVAVISSSQVESEDDLEVFESNMSLKDQMVSKVDIDSENNGESEVKVVYRHKGKLFGFIPVIVKSTTIVESNVDGKVEVHSKKSWYSFLVRTENYSKSEIESRVKNNETIKVNAQVNASAQAKAKIAEAVVAEIGSYTKASASVQK